MVVGPSNVSLRAEPLVNFAEVGRGEAVWARHLISPPEKIVVGPLRQAQTACRGGGGMPMCMPRVPKMTPSETALDLQLPRHHLAHFRCAKFCLFLIPPSAVVHSA